MTTATHPVTGQSAGTSMLGQQGTFGPGFPPPIGAEQFFGLGPQTQSPYQAAAVGPLSFNAPGSMPWQSGGTAQSYPIQQVTAQITPVALQAILPHVISAACQQVQQQLPQIVAQLTMQQQGPQWQQYQTQLPGQGVFGQGVFGQGTRPQQYPG